MYSILTHFFCTVNRFFLKNKKNYIKDNKLDDEILNLRKKLFNIDELKEFLKIQNNLRLLSININNIILSVLD